jgi:hypothetical protein
VRANEKEGDEFTVESIVKLDSVDVNAELRTLVSHWDGGKASLESFGWSIDVTGQKSRYKPRNILMQFVGEDENANIGYQVVASDIHIEVGRRYHLVVRVSSSASPASPSPCVISIRPAPPRSPPWCRWTLSRRSARALRRSSSAA